MFATRGEALPVSAVYAREGVHLTPAGKGSGSRIAGWQRIHSYLAEAPACPHHLALGWQTCPRLHVFSTLENWWREMTALPHATQLGVSPEDADTRAPDHLADATRYVLAGLGAGPEFTVFDDVGESAPVEMAVISPERSLDMGQGTRCGPDAVGSSARRYGASAAWRHPLRRIEIRGEIRKIKIARPRNLSTISRSHV
jgi:hypothetical protein